MNLLADDQLTHEKHLAQYLWAMNGNEANDGYFKRQAAEMHALVVADAVSDFLVKAVQVGQAKGGAVHDHLVYGVARRAGDIRVSLRDIISVSPPERTNPLTQNETDVVSRGLNTIYINLRGTLDNLAYAIIEKHGGLEAVGLKPLQVDLLGAKFLKNAKWEGLAAELSEFQPWASELAERRNPAAHRIPLSVIPAIMTEEQLAERHKLIREMIAPLPEGPIDFDKKKAEHEAIKTKIAKLGTYRPQFAHNPNDGVIDIYPTVAEDVGKTIRVARLVIKHIA